MSDERFIEIESKLAHQEQLLAELNTALTDQQGQLTKVSALCESLLDRMQSMSDSAPAGDPADERPPHY